MAEYPAWNKMTDQQKFEFLNEWCRNMDRQIRQQNASIAELCNRLSAVEAKVGHGHA
jgi:predicted Fe-S protein YdhL (DUF1289 family)